MDQPTAQPADAPQQGEDRPSFAEMYGLDPEHGDPSAPPAQSPHTGSGWTAPTQSAPTAPASESDPMAEPAPSSATPTSENPSTGAGDKPDESPQREPRQPEGLRDPNRPVSASELIYGSRGGAGSPKANAHGSNSLEISDQRVTRAFGPVELTPEQNRAEDRIRERAMQLVQEIYNSTPQCADQSAAVRKVREAFHAASDSLARRL